MSLLSLELFYVLAGSFLALVSARALLSPGARLQRAGAALFWAMLAACFLFGRLLPPLVVGYLVLAMVLIAALGALRPPAATEEAPRAERAAHAQRLGNRIFWPALVIPATAVIGSLSFARIHLGSLRLVDPAEAALVSLSLGALLALGSGTRLTHAPVRLPLAGGADLLSTIGWALLLPQALAALGGIFARAGMGPLVAGMVERLLPVHGPTVSVVAYCVGMLLFTMCLGNAFAAFAVITGGIGLPLIVARHGGNPAIMGAIGMLAGYCGTLVTPLAANFNLVPVMLLQLRDEHAVIKAQLPIAAVLFVFNVALMAACVYRF
jgi:uncharacterized membrane protein